MVFMRDENVPFRFEKGAKGNLKVPNSFVIGKVYATYQKIDDTLKSD